MAYPIRDTLSHPPGYNGLYSAQEVKQGIINFIIKDRQENGDRIHATQDIILGLQKLYNIEFDFHSVEYVMRNILSKEGTKQVGTKIVNAVSKKCQDGETREFLVPQAAAKNLKHKSKTTKPHIPSIPTEEQFLQLYKKKIAEFGWGKNNNNPGTFTEFKKNLGY